ncbi:hypothetical protein B808_711 [Fructilactobacillus florum 8D]|uniref:Integral membrane protein n=2 Tax=Fructilactobacillus florum TaxID=640331 RepID=W9EGI1_9LACO|nr:membrane protein [Fructilactobacillus florum]EKK20393.1 hypothetical protein B807_850 [Fructilactobacillus florum 2F]ETO40361.1 hypothetical protein B808_711 [Fructilactobacillus florum 8D]
MDNQSDSANEAQKNPSFTTWGKIINVFLRTLMSFVGIAILSTGAALLKSSPILGLDPFTAVNIGIAAKLHTSLGVYQLIANLIIFVFVVLLNRKMIGIGTIMNMVLVGFEIQWFSSLYHQLLPGKATALILIANLIIGLLLFTAGSSLYMAPSLGVAPYDAIAPIASSRLHCQYKTARVVQDICFLTAAVLVHGPVGFASIVVAFFAGPLISFWNRTVSTPVLGYINDFSGNPTAKNLAQGVRQVTRSGYKSLSNAYNSTLDFQMHLAGYTNKELATKIQDTQYQMQESQRKYNSYRTEYRMLIAEMVKRDKRGQLPNSNNDSDTNESPKS